MDIVLHEAPKDGYRWLYGYTDDLLRSSTDADYQRLIKVGDTTRTVHQRVVVEQDGTDRSTKPIVLFTMLIPASFRDHAIHHELELMGHTRFRDDKDREFFVIKEDSEESRIAEVQIAVQRATKDNMAARNQLELTPDQYEALEDALDAFDAGNTTLLEELCPRFGKTVWAMALHKCLSERVMVVATYWLSALTSFKNDIVNFEEFVDFVYVDASKDGYDLLINEALDLGKKVVVGVSLHKDNMVSKKEDLKPLADISDKWVFIDEADFGAWRETQKELVDYMVGV